MNKKKDNNMDDAVNTTVWNRTTEIFVNIAMMGIGFSLLIYGVYMLYEGSMGGLSLIFIGGLLAFTFISIIIIDHNYKNKEGDTE